jgi:hypothetical protein
MSRCIDIPVSWWTLERYTIGDVSPDEKALVEKHLAACPLCLARLKHIDVDDRPLPKLSVTPGAKTAREPWFYLGDWRLRVVALGAAAAMVLVLVLPLLPEDGPSSQQGRGVAERGGDPTFIVVRQRDGVVATNPSDYAPGDRFRLELTLPGTKARHVETVVFQEDDVYFPSDDVAVVTPGNHNILPGVFRVTKDADAPITICVILGPDLVDRAKLISDGPAALPGDAICKTVMYQAPER